MKIIHMSDLHLTGNGTPVWGENSRRKFMSALSQVRSMEDIDVIIVSGDISDDGTIDSYIYADQEFAKLNIPTYWCAGNHDNLDTLAKIFRPSFCHIGGQVLIDGWRLYVINSVAIDEYDPNTNRSRGIVTSQQREKLNKQLDMQPEPSVIVLHHPPLEIGGWQDDKILKDRDTFRALLYKHDNVRIVLSGHVHCFSIKKEKNIIYTTASSIGYAISSQMPRYTIEQGNEGFSCITLNEKEIIVENILLNR